MSTISHKTLFYLTILSQCLFSYAASDNEIGTPTATTSSTTNYFTSFPTMSATDGGGVAEGGVGSSVTGVDAGASGADHGSFGMSKGGVIGMSVGIAIAVLIIGTLWTLWYLTKKRQWNIRDSIKRASRRLTGRKAAPTPSRANRRGTVMLKDPKNPDIERGLGGGRTKPHMGWLADEKEITAANTIANGRRGS